MNIFSEVKECMTARQAAEGYGLKISKNGTACCPFHNDRHPSMKIERNYYCFACGAKGDVIGYVAQMFGLSQYEAAKKLVRDFGLPITINIKRTEKSREEKIHFKRKIEEQERIIHIKERFRKWCNHTTDTLKECLSVIKEVRLFMRDKPLDIVFSNDYAQMLHAEPLINYWLDILCMGCMEEKQELFLKGRKEVGILAERVRCTGHRIMERNRGSVGCRDEQRGRCLL